jgi:hypothetical protein
MDMEARAQPEYAFNGGSADRDVSWTAAPTDSTASADARAAILEAERARKEDRIAHAAAMLLPHMPNLGVYGRSLLLEVLLAQGALDDVLRLLARQLGPEEIPKVIAALIEARRAADAELLLVRYEDVLTPDAVSFFRQRLRLLGSGGVRGH